MDGTELGDRCLEVRLSQSIDRFDISFGSNVAAILGSRTLLIKSEDMSCQISSDFEGIFRSIELERDLGAGLPPLSARFFLIEFATTEAAEAALKHPNYTVAEAQKHMQSYTIGTNNTASSSFVPQSSSEEVLIYGIPASKLLDPTTLRSKSSSYPTDDKSLNSSSSYRSRSKSCSRSKSPRGHRGDHRQHYRGRERDYDDYDRHHRDRKRSRSRSSGGERHRRRP